MKPGDTLGAYQVLAMLGEGGMGEVYRARDTRLKRDVALKVLPDAVAGDQKKLARFQREAELLATLNHPNIAAIYGIEEADGAVGLALELVEGEDLSRHIARGALPLPEALAIARQIADALEAAHERGVIHRDLKPANIKITPDGRVKVLDFGLAKMLEPGASSGDFGGGSSGPRPSALTMPPAMASPAMTMRGAIVGTPAYMSPEQARGTPADRRADIWAFGCVLFEMLTGKRAFDAGDSVSDAIVAVLSREPDWTALPADLPPRVRTVLGRCLQKDARKRLRDIADVRLELDEEPLDAAAPALAVLPTAPRRPAWRRATGAVAIALIAAVIGGVSVWRFAGASPSGPVPVTRFSFLLPEGQQLSRPGHQFVAVSPDGSRIVYVANGRLYVRPMSELAAREIPGTNLGAENPAFSPDGQSIVFSARSEGALKRIALSGGAPVTICPAGAVFGLHWAWDGSILFAQEQGARGILRVSAGGGTPKEVVAVKGREQAHGPQLLPDGDHVLFTLATGTGGTRWDTAQIVVQSIKTGERKTLVNGGTDGRYLPGGHLVYGLAGALLAVRFDLQRLELVGGPLPVVEGVRSSMSVSGSMQFAVSDTGTLVYVAGRVGALSDARDLALADRSGTVERLRLPAREYANPRVSPDGTRVAVGIDDGNTSDIWIYELSGASPIRRLTFGGRNRLPIWSHDARRIAFQSDREGDEGIFWQPADGSGSAERLTKAETGVSHAPESWSPDDAHILYSATTGTNVVLWSLSPADRKAAPFGTVSSSEPTNAVFSPDGRWVAYTTTEGGSRRILVQPFPPTGARYEVSESAGSSIYPMWSADGKELLWVGGGGGGSRSFTAVSVNARQGFAVGNPVVLPNRLGVIGPSVQRTLDLTPAGKFIGVVVPESTRTEPPVAPMFQVVLGWFEELKAKVPTGGQAK
jgi:serine/threonine-protein kinase